MKKSIKAFGNQLLTAILTAALLVSCFAVCASAVTVDKFGDDHKAYDERLYGDVNLDWEVNEVDYMLVKRAVLGTFSISKDNFRQIDIDQNDEIDVTDYLLIKRSILGLIAPLGFAPPRELRAKHSDLLTDEELYEEIDKEIAMANRQNVTELYIWFQRFTRETQAAEVLSSLGLPDDLGDKSVYTGYSWLHTIHGLTLTITIRVPSELSLREVMFKLYRCAEIDDPVFNLYAPEA